MWRQIILIHRLGVKLHYQFKKWIDLGSVNFFLGRSVILKVHYLDHQLDAFKEFGLGKYFDLDTSILMEDVHILEKIADIHILYQEAMVEYLMLIYIELYKELEILYLLVRILWASFLLIFREVLV